MRDKLHSTFYAHSEQSDYPIGKRDIFNVQQFLLRNFCSV